MLQQFVAGIAMGLAMSAPIGAVNLLVIRTALANGFSRAFLASLGAVAADVLMASAVGFGIGAVGEFVAGHERVLYAIAGTMLVVVGVKAARTRFAELQLQPLPQAAGVGLTFMLCMTNPGLYLGYAGLFGAMNAMFQRGGQGLSPALVIAGIALGSALWWGFLSWLMTHVAARLNTKLVERINRWAAILVAAFGFVLLSQAWG